MSDQNPYSTPQSNVDYRSESGEFSGGNYNWTINDVLNEAWAKISGFKLVYMVAIIVYVIISQGLAFALQTLAGESVGVLIIGNLLLSLVTYPLAAGLMMMGIKRSAGLEVNFSTLFDYYNQAIPLFILGLLVSLFSILGLILLIIPGIYLMVAYMLAMPLMVEKKLGIWESMETSRQAITQCWFRFFGLMLLMMLIIVVSIIPLGIGLIWTLPMTALVLGIVYRELFGLEFMR